MHFPAAIIKPSPRGFTRRASKVSADDVPYMHCTKKYEQNKARIKKSQINARAAIASPVTLCIDA
jgi:hypothetical protein